MPGDHDLQRRAAAAAEAGSEIPIEWLERVDQVRDYMLTHRLEGLERTFRFFERGQVRQELMNLAEWCKTNPGGITSTIYDAMYGSMKKAHDKILNEMRAAGVAGHGKQRSKRNGAAAPARNGAAPGQSLSERRGRPWSPSDREGAARWAEVLEVLRELAPAETIDAWLSEASCEGLSPVGCWLRLRSEFGAGMVESSLASQIGEAAAAVLEREGPVRVYLDYEGHRRWRLANAPDWEDANATSGVS